MIRWLVRDIYGFIWVQVLSTDQDMLPARREIYAHVQSFFVNGESIRTVHSLATR